MKGDIGPKERENWNKVKSKGKKRYILSSSLAITADEVWIRNTIKFEEENALPEIDDANLKSFISSREKIKAVKRYRELTGGSHREAIRYVDLFTDQ